MSCKKFSLYFLGVFVLSCMVLLGRSVVAQDYQALKGVESIKAIFDVRSGDPMNVFGHLQLIHKTFKGDSIRNIDSDPEFAVVFTDKSVLLLSQNRNDYTEKEVQVLKKMDQLVAAMEQEGITLEVCLFALDYFNVDKKSVTKDVNRVPNGWISTIGYQSRGYSLVPVY